MAIGKFARYLTMTAALLWAFPGTHSDTGRVERPCSALPLQQRPASCGSGRFGRGLRRAGVPWPYAVLAARFATLGARAQLVDALDSASMSFCRRHAELVQRLGDALLEDRLELVPLLAGLGRDVAGHRAHLAGHVADLFFGHGPASCVCRLAPSFTSVSNTLPPSSCALAEGAQAGEPDLLRRFLDGAGQLAVEQAARRRRLLLVPSSCSFLTMCVLLVGCVRRSTVSSGHTIGAPLGSASLSLVSAALCAGAPSGKRAAVDARPFDQECAAARHRHTGGAHAVLRHRRHRLHRQAPGQDPAGAARLDGALPAAAAKARARWPSCSQYWGTTKARAHAGLRRPHREEARRRRPTTSRR